MIPLSMETVIFSHGISSAICLIVMILLWHQNRKNFAGIDLWLANSVLQLVASLLIVLRGRIPDFASIVLANTLIIGGIYLLYLGLERFVGKRSSQVHNYIILVTFVLIHSYYTFVQPSLLVRNINVTLGIFLISCQAAWLLLHRVEGSLRPLIRNIGFIAISLCLITVARIFLDLTRPIGEDFLRSNPYDVLLVLSSQMLFIILTFGLILTVNHRLVKNLEQDITERKLAEEELHRNAHLNAALAALYPPLVTPDSNIKSIASIVFEQACNLTGSAHGYVSEVDPLTGDSIGHTLTEMLAGQCKVQGEGQQIVFPRKADGTYSGLWGYALNTKQAFYNNNPADHPASTGTPSGHIPIKQFLSVPVLLGKELVGQIALSNPARDYTEQDFESIRRLADFYALAIQRKRAEAALQENENRLRTIFETSQAGIILIDPKGVITFANQYMGDMFGCSLNELIGSTYPEHVHPDQRETEDQKIRQLIAKEFDSIALERHYIRTNGSDFWGFLSGRRQEDEQGNLTSLVCIIADISELKHAEDTLRAVLHDKEVLLRELYHRTKNNMQVISSMLNLELDRIDDQEGMKILQDMDNRIRSMALVHQKLYQSQNLSSLDLKDYISDLANLMIESYQTTPGRIDFSMEAGSVPVLIDIAVPCGLIINEILSNSLKYAFPEDKGGNIHIRLEQAEDTILLEVSDDGVGVPPEQNLQQSNTLGIQTIFGIAGHQLNAKVDLKTDQGVTWRIQFSNNLYTTRV